MGKARTCYGGCFRKNREDFFRNIRKKFFQKISGSRVLPDETKGHPEESFFRKVSGRSGSSGKFSEGSFWMTFGYSGRATFSGNFPEEQLLSETLWKNYFFRKFGFFLKILFCFFFKMNEVVILFL